MKRKKRIRRILIILGICFWFLLDKEAYANSEVTNESINVDYNEIQHVIDDITDKGNDFDFGQYVSDLVTGEQKLSFTDILEDIKNGVLEEIKSNMGNFTSIIAIALIAAIFTNLSHAFLNNQVADTGFYVTYLLLFSVLTVSFITASTIAAETISSILTFMKVLVPSYIMALAFSTGVATSYVFYESTLFLITFVDLILIKVVIPMINIHFIIAIANNLSKEDMLSKLSEILSQGVSWVLKTLLTLVIGLNATQGLISPVADRLKRTGLMKTAEAIPGIGDILGGVAESVLSAGILLKNAIGIAGVIVIIIVCSVPLLKIGVTTLIFKISSAAVQPISDKRMVNCISATANASGLLLHTVFVSVVLFIITITLIAVTTT